MDGQGKRVTIYVSSTEYWHRQPLSLAILELLRREDCAGATATQGVAGFGGGRHIKTAGVVDMATDLPVVITWVDRPDRVERVLPRVAEMVTAGLITVEDIYIYHSATPLRERLPEVQVGDVMTQTVTSVHPDASLAEVVEKLIDKDYAALPVVDATNRVIGIVSDTDLLKRGDMEVGLSRETARGLDLGRTLLTRLRQSSHTVAKIMTPEPVTIGPQAYLSEAARLMSEKGLRRLPVVDQEHRLLGMLGRLDILTATLAAGSLPQTTSRSHSGSHAAQPRTVADVMDPNVPMVPPETGLPVVLALLAGTWAKRVVVVDAERHVVGIISDSDLLMRMNPEVHPGILLQLAGRLRLGMLSTEAQNHLQKAKAKTAANLMTAEVVTLVADTPLETALALSAERKITRFPVVDAAGTLVGLVGRSELLSALAEEPGERPE